MLIKCKSMQKKNKLLGTREFVCCFVLMAQTTALGFILYTRGHCSAFMFSVVCWQIHSERLSNINNVFINFTAKIINHLGL